MQIDLTLLNVTELTQLIRQRLGVVVKASVSKERLASFLYGFEQPTTEDLAGSNQTRLSLAVFIDKNRNVFESQLPCKGENRGRCTIYPCPEGRHADCFNSASPHIV